MTFDVINYNCLFCIFKATDWVFHTGRICHVWYNFYPGYTRQTTIIFGTVKDSSLKINSLPSSNGCIYKNVLQNGVNSLSEMVLKNFGFCPKAQKYCTVLTIRFGSNFTSMWFTYMYVSNNVRTDFRIPMPGFAMVARKRFNGKFTAEIGF